MLTRSVHGWSDFQLEGTSAYGLSYLDDIAFEWLDQAIHGLETMLQFCQCLCSDIEESMEEWFGENRCFL